MDGFFFIGLKLGAYIVSEVDNALLYNNSNLWFYFSVVIDPATISISF
jgi:hypothetical protein